MKKIILTSIITFVYFFSIGQTKNSPLSKVNSVSEAKAFIEKNPSSKAELFTLDSGIDTTIILQPLYQKMKGFSFQIDNFIYKILDIDSTLSFRASYIYLNGEKYSKFEIDSLREEIISKYKNGANFIDLVLEYNMDRNITGDTNWFTENTMVKGFEIAVREHKKGEIFLVDTPSQNWFHVVLKTFDNTYIKKLIFIKVKSSS